MDESTKYVPTPNGSVAYRVFGSGPIDVLLMSGTFSHLDLMWADPQATRFLRRLGSFARVVMFDRAGMGLSDAVTVVPTLEERVGEVEAVLEAADMDQVSVLGFSECGALAGYFAAGHPGRVRSIVFGSAFVKGSDDGCDWGIPAAALESLAEVLARWGEGRSLELVGPSMAGSPLMRRMFGTFERAMAGPGTVRAFVDALRGTDASGILGCIDVPALVVARRGDRMVPIAQARKIAELLPAGTLVELDGDDHVPWFGDGDAYVDAIEQFFTGTVTSRDADRAMVTVMFTDIVGSTERLRHVGDRAWSELVARHDEVVRRNLDLHGGSEVKTLGDGFLATFPGPLAAVLCARAVALEVRPLGLEVRSGVHTGEVQIVGRDIAGMTVNMAARVAACAGAGEVLVSSAVHDLLAGTGGRFEPRGCHDLKGIGPCELYRTAAPERIRISADPPQRLGLVDRLTLEIARRRPGVGRAAMRITTRRGIART